jgi:ankyrin repeat protein
MEMLDQSDSVTVLQYAVTIHDPPLALMCIRADTDLEATNKNKQTALEIAVYLGHHEIVNMLLAAGCSLRFGSSGTLAPFSIAAYEGPPGILKMLTREYEKPFRKKRNNLRGYTIPHIATFSGGIFVCAYLNDEVVMNKLIKSGIYNMNLQDKEGLCALMIGAMKGYTNVVEMLLENGCDKDAVDVTGQTAVHHACANGHHATAGCLCSNACDFDIIDKNGLSATDLSLRYLARANITTGDEAVDDLRKKMQAGEMIQQTLKKKKENKRKNLMKKKKKRNAARQSIVPVTYDIDSDDEEINKCDCAECLALNAKLDAEALGV